VDASQAGEGNLEITISARGHNIPTQVHPQGNARFTVSFLPIEPIDHVVNINFNKESVPGKCVSSLNCIFVLKNRPIKFQITKHSKKNYVTNLLVWKIKFYPAKIFLRSDNLKRPVEILIDGG